MKKNLLNKLVEEAKNRDAIDRLVVGAVIESDGKVLLLQRPEDDFMGGIYELPSGKVEQGEDLDQALRREVMEETGLTVTRITGYLGSFDYSSKSGRRTRQFNFTVEVAGAEPIRLQEHAAFAWISPDELDSLPVTDSTKSVLRIHWEGR